MEIDVNNISTMASMIWGVIVYPILMAVGIEINQGLGTAIIGAIILLALLIWSAMNPNTMETFGNGVTDDESDSC